MAAEQPVDVAGEPVRALAEAFHRREEELYLVGGAVRDELLGKSGFDLDFATSALPPCTIEIIDALGIGSPYRVGERYGTIGVRAGERLVEITTYRSAETYAPGSRKPDVRLGGSLRADLARRDFTVNAMAREPLSGEMVDPFHGMEDLIAGVIRAVGDPVERFNEDPLRLLRAIRLAAQLGFDIEAATWEAIAARSAAVKDISRERVRDEYGRILTGPAPARGLTLLRDSGLMAATVPQLLELDAMPDHGPRHPLSLWDHTMLAVASVPADLTVRWAALLHDIAKPATRTHEADGRPRFFGHEEMGAAMARRILRSLRYSNQVVDEVMLLVETHMQIHAYSTEWSDGAVRRLMLCLGPLLPSAIDLARADAAAHTLDGRAQNAPRYDQLARRLETLEQEPANILKSPLSGEDLMARYGRPPGPWIRRIKDALQEEVVDGHLQSDDRDSAWRVADELIEAEG